MADESLKSLFTSIANAIRSKTGKADSINAIDFPKAINSITSINELKFNEIVETTALDFYCQAICYGDGKFVAVGSRLNLGLDTANNNTCEGAYSIDGINWVALRIPTVYSLGDYCRDICYGNGKFVICTKHHLLTSINGIDWEVACTASDVWAESTYTPSFHSISYGNNTFTVGMSTAAAISPTFCILSSNDLIAWVRSYTLTNTYARTKIKYIANTFFILTEQNTFSCIIHWSTDLTSWKSKTLSDVTDNISDFTSDTKILTITTHDYIDALNSPKRGEDDLETTKYIYYAGAEDINSLQELVHSSYEGIRSITSVTYENNLFVATLIGTNVVLYSADGMNWMSTLLPISAKWHKAFYSNGKWFIVGNGVVAYTE